MNKKVNAEQLTGIIFDLKVNEKLTVKEPVDGISFGIEKMNWNDAMIILFGGYATEVSFVDISEAFYNELEIRENILKMVNEKFEGWGIESVVID